MRYAQLAKEAAEILAAARAEGEARGEARGLAKGEADALRTVLAARGFELTRAYDERIERCADCETLRGWVRRAVTATTLREVFASD